MGTINNHIVIFSSGRNCENYIEKYTKTVLLQNYNNFEVIVIDDNSSDSTYSILKSIDDKRLCVRRNRIQIGAAHNLIKYLGLVNPNDIILRVDPDDYLPNPEVLKYINEIYNKTDCWTTYGSFVWESSNKRDIEPYRKEIIDNKLYRLAEWKGAHLFTFRGFLFHNIRITDLLDWRGNFITSACDMAVVFPILEMTPSNKIQFIPDILYIYNDGNPKNICKEHKWDQLKNELIVRSKAPYEELPYESCLSNR